jgi:hypothetical protein
VNSNALNKRVPAHDDDQNLAQSPRLDLEPPGFLGPFHYFIQVLGKEKKR